MRPVQIVITLSFFEASVRIVHAFWKILKPWCETGLIGEGRWDCWYLTDKLISDFGFISCHFIGWSAWCAASSQWQKARNPAYIHRWTGCVFNKLTATMALPVLGLLGLHICNPAEVLTSFLAKETWHHIRKGIYVLQFAFCVTISFKSCI